MSIYGFEGQEPIIHPKAYVHDSAQVIGNVVIGEDCFVGAGAIVRGDYCEITIGARTAVEEGCIIHAPPAGTCDIGSDVVLGHGAIVHCSQIGTYARIGMGAILGYHSVVGEWIILGDGAVVPPKTSIASGGVYVGNPAREVRRLSDKDREGSVFVVRNYADLCSRYHKGLRRLSP